jgi:cytochrome c oxidase assembly protein subunit 15
MQKLAYKIAWVATLLAVCVVMLGAYTRLVHAGLGCPDWPTCYGHVWVPNTEGEIAIANQHFSQTPVQINKTWPEQTHRLFASSLGFLSLILLFLAIKQASHQQWKSIVGLLVLLIAGMVMRGIKGDGVDPILWLLAASYFLNLIRLAWQYGSTPAALKLSAFIAGFIVLQGFFGMWTVTLKLWPQVVTAHLLGGFTMLSTLFLLTLRLGSSAWLLSHTQFIALKNYHTIALIGLVVVAFQICLGGWTSSNYAALACIDLPTCQGQFIPNMDLKSGFNIFQKIGPNYLGGILDSSARIAIHFIHRVGAIIVTIFTFGFVIALWKHSTQSPLRPALTLLMLALVVQISLGISNVIFSLPLPVAVLHNLGGALLLLAWVNMNYRLISAKEA